MTVEHDTHGLGRDSPGKRRAFRAAPGPPAELTGRA
jgi:hypothetical protein